MSGSKKLPEERAWAFLRPTVAANLKKYVVLYICGYDLITKRWKIGCSPVWHSTSFITRQEALREAERRMAKYLGSGFHQVFVGENVDIESKLPPGYVLEARPVAVPAPKETKSKEPVPNEFIPASLKGKVISLLPHDGVVRCVDNRGLDGFFRVGVEYVYTPVDSKFLTVYDVEGKPRTCYADRFAVVEKAKVPVPHMTHFGSPVASK